MAENIRNILRAKKGQDDTMNKDSINTSPSAHSSTLRATTTSGIAAGVPSPPSTQVGNTSAVLGHPAAYPAAYPAASPAAPPTVPPTAHPTAHPAAHPAAHQAADLAKEEFSLPTPSKPIQPFLVTTYLVADALASRSIKLPAFRVQVRHLSIQALGLTLLLNHGVDPERGATDEQYEEGFDLDNIFLEFGRSVDMIAPLRPEEAFMTEIVHEKVLDEVFRKLFKERSFYPYSYDPDADQVWMDMREHDRSVLRYPCEVHMSDINEFQLPSTPKDADLVSKPDPIAESAAKDDQRLVRRLTKLMEEFDDIVRSRSDLANNVQSGTIRIPGGSHDPNIHRAVRDLLEGSNNAVLRRFQENSVKMNQIITQVREEANLPETCKVHLYELGNPKGGCKVCVLPDSAKTIDDLISHLVDEEFFEEGPVHMFLRKNHVHELTPKGRHWELAEGSLNLRFPDSIMSQVEREDGSLVFDWVTRDDDFVIALLDNGIEEMGAVLNLPKRDRLTNKRVRDHLETSPTIDLQTYEIDSIRDIEKPNDENVGDAPFHRNAFQSRRHNLVVKLRPLDGSMRRN